jgi:hypothetical protein
MPRVSRAEEAVRIGATGHRVLAETDKVRAGIERALGDIRATYPEADLIALSSLAEGADRLVAEQILAASGRLIVPLPQERDEYAKDFATEASKREFWELLAQAEEVVEVPPQATRREAYRAAGIVVLDRCDVLVAVWDGRPAQGAGGTAEIVELARARGLPVAWVHAGNRRPGTMEATTLGEEQGRVTWENCAVTHGPAQRG